jgi:hypothetical protein
MTSITQELIKRFTLSRSFPFMRHEVSSVFPTHVQLVCGELVLPFDLEFQHGVLCSPNTSRQWKP